jgi:hypothetical protein
LETESPKAYQAFCLFRDLGTRRTLAQVYDAIRAAKQAASGLPVVPRKSKYRTTGQITEWSAKNQWFARAAAWDQDQDRIRREAHNAEIVEMAKRQARLGVLAQMKASQRFAKIDPDKLTVKEATNLARVGVTIERTARGEATEIVKTENRTEHTVSSVEQFKNIPLEKLTLLDEALKDVFAQQDQPKAEVVEQNPATTQE